MSNNYTEIHPIDCIAVPTVPQEIGDLSVLFACWSLFHGSQQICSKLLITYPQPLSEKTHDDIERAIIIFGIDKMFSSIEIRVLDIPNEDDIYIRHGDSHTGEIPRLGHKSGPNTQFFRTVYSAKNHSYLFLHECDVYPLAPDWLEGLCATLRTGHDWVLGSNYKGSIVLGPDIMNHINGSAVYAVGDSSFQDFCRNFWEPGLEEMCRDKPDTAYDIWMARMHHKLSTDSLFWSKLPPDFIKEFRNALSRFAVTGTIANLSIDTNTPTVNELLDSGYKLVHGKKFMTEALCNAISHANAKLNCTLSRVQILSLLARCNSPSDILPALEMITPIPLPNRIISLYHKRKAQQKEDSFSATSMLGLDGIEPRFYGIQDSSLVPSTCESKDLDEDSSLYAFSPFKSGSTLLFNALELMSAPLFLDRTYLSPYDLSFQKYGDTHSWLSHINAKSMLLNNRHIYGGFRDADPFTGSSSLDIRVPLIEMLLSSNKKPLFIFLYRDPRDCLVSLYYSHLKSHIIPNASEYLLVARRRSENISIDSYIRENAKSFRDATYRMMALSDAAISAGFSVLEFAYEDILYNQYNMFSGISSAIGRTLEPDKWHELIRRSRDPQIGCSTPINFVPDSENDQKHIRKASPGDHLTKISKGLSTTLRSCFSSYFNRLAKINPNYDYL
jgi:hypothetical protein